MSSRMRHSAFSLVELSIVLVILGLLTGGILSGQSLLRAAELRSVNADAQRYVAATYAFRDKYFTLPGDLSTATKFWGDNNSVCADNAIPNGTPGVCNGSGDGNINYFVTAAAGAPAETFQAWLHMAYAGMVEGNFTGLAGPSSANHGVINSNVPGARLKNGAWGFISYDSLNPSTADTNMFNGIIYGNTLQLGSINGTGGPGGKLLKPEEAWNIDTKMDDGHPVRGKVVAKFLNSECSIPNTGVASQTNHDVRYNLTENSIQCSLSFTRFQ